MQFAFINRRRLFRMTKGGKSLINVTNVIHYHRRSVGLIVNLGFLCRRVLALEEPRERREAHHGEEEERGGEPAPKSDYVVGRGRREHVAAPLDTEQRLRLDDGDRQPRLRANRLDRPGHVSVHSYSATYGINR